jgi:hypothetical protein
MRRVEAELVHDPAGLDAVGGAALVEDERLPHADDGAGGRAAHLAVLAGGLPVAALLVARFVRDPVAYLRSLKLKKYHSLAVSFAASDMIHRDTIHPSTQQIYLLINSTRLENMSIYTGLRLR